YRVHTLPSFQPLHPLVFSKVSFYSYRVYPLTKPHYLFVSCRHRHIALVVAFLETIHEQSYLRIYVARTNRPSSYHIIRDQDQIYQFSLKHNVAEENTTKM